MRKIATIIILITIIFQIAPAISIMRLLSVSDFTTKRGAFCEIFVEPN